MIKQRLKEFKQKRTLNEKFIEMSFCILTANSTAEQCIKVQKKIGKGFLTLKEKKLQQQLKKHGARFHTKRANYIWEARKKKKELGTALKKLKGEELREWITKNIKGLGMKESSHFLRNIGYTDYAIIDFHIIDNLVKQGKIIKPKTMNKEKYLEIESELRKIAKRKKMSLAELDLHLWKKETGKVLK